MTNSGERQSQFLQALHHRARPLVMAIINLTPDSFHPASRVNLAHLEDHVRAAVAEGADCLDLGAESTRPGSSYVDAATELDRLLPALRRIRAMTDLPLSVDTRKAAVARAALDAGADIINDISAGLDDPDMVSLLSERGCPYIIMHRQGEPSTMQDKPHYADVVSEVRTFLEGRIDALLAAGLRRDSLVLDPGMGFGKDQEHNRQLLAHLDAFVDLGLPVLLGHSRKGFIGKALGDSAGPRPVEGRLAGSLALGVYAALKGVRMLRVHDTEATVDSLRVLEALQEGVNHA